MQSKYAFYDEWGVDSPGWSVVAHGVDGERKLYPRRMGAAALHEFQL